MQLRAPCWPLCATSLAELLNTVSGPTTGSRWSTASSTDRLIEVRPALPWWRGERPPMGVRSTVHDLDQQAVYLALLVSSICIVHHCRAWWR